MRAHRKRWQNLSHAWVLNQRVCVHSMSQNQFSYFCHESRICGSHAVKEGRAVKLASIDRIFLRANMDRSTGKFNAKTKEDVAREAGGKGKGKGLKADAAMEEMEFVAALVRLGYAKFFHVSLATALEDLFQHCLLKNRCFEAVDDDIAMKLANPSQQLQNILDKHHFALLEAFCSAAALTDGDAAPAGGAADEGKKGKKGKGKGKGKGKKQIAAAADGQTTINLEEWLRFLEKHKLLGAQLTVREARMIFVQANLDDELYLPPTNKSL